MSISKVNGVAWASIAKLTGRAKADLAKFGGQSVPASVVYFLTTYSGAELAFSFRKLASSAQNCIEVTNDSGTATDIGFDSNGYLDTASIASHCSTGNGRISKWYDQSGNNRHATQTSTSQMPLIYQSGSMRTENGKASAYFDGGDRLVIASAQVHTGSFFATSVIKVPNDRNGSIRNQDDPYTPSRFRVAQYLRTGSANSGTGRVVVFNTSGSNFADNSAAHSNSNQFQLSSYATSSGTIDCRLNESSNGTSSYSGTLKTGSHELAIGSNVHGSTPAAYHGGDIQELILWDGDQPSARANIESAVDTYYSIP